MIPLHLRKKNRAEKPKPLHFEVMPPIGSLLPGHRVNVQIKFMPTEEVGGRFFKDRNDSITNNIRNSGNILQLPKPRSDDMNLYFG